MRRRCCAQEFIPALGRDRSSNFYCRYLQHLLWVQPARACRVSSTSKSFAGHSHQHLELRAVSMRGNRKPEGREMWRQKVIAATSNAFLLLAAEGFSTDPSQKPRLCYDK